MSREIDSDAPVITWFSDPVGPDETVMLAGWNLGEGVIELRRLEDASSDRSTCNGNGLSGSGENRWTVIRPILQQADSLHFVVPAGFAAGVYACRLRRGDWTSNIVRLNAPDVWWMQGDAGSQATSGGWLRLFGKCLGDGPDSRIELRGRDGSVRVLSATPVDDYAITAVLPDDLSTDEYVVRVHNGLGGEDGWSDAGKFSIQTPVCCPPLCLNVQDFGARPNSGIDCTQAIVQALERLHAAGGGVLYFPRGRYRVNSGLRSGLWIDTPLRIPPGVTLRGESMELVSLWWPERKEPLPSLIEGGDDFAVENLTLYTHGRHRNAITGGSHVRIHRVRIRANAYFQLDAVGKEHRGRNVSEFSTEMGCAIELTGRNVQVTECDIVHTGRGIVLKNVLGGLIARNILRTGCGYVQFNGGDGVVFENNHCSGGHLSATGGGLTLFFGAMAARHYYFAHNKIEHIYGGDRETLTLDGHGTAYVGHVRQVDDTTIELAGDAVFRNSGRDGISDPRGATIYLLAGKGVGQWRTIRDMNGRQVSIDRAWTIPPDESSVAYIGRFNGRHLIIGNEVSDSGYLVQLYPPNFQCIVANNTGRRTGKMISLGWAGYNRLLMHKRIGPSWFNQFIDNEFLEGNGWGGEKNEKFSNSSGGGASMLVWATLSSWVHDEHNHEHFRPLRREEMPDLLNTDGLRELFISRWQVVRGHVGHNNSSIRIRGAISDAVVENCRIENNDVGIIVEADVTDADAVTSSPRNVVLRRNRFSGVPQPMLGDALEQALVDPQCPEVPPAPQVMLTTRGRRQVQNRSS